METKDQDKPKLGLKKTLSLKKNIDTESLRKAYIDSHANNVIVEVKRNKIQNNFTNTSFQEKENLSSDSLTTQEYNKRIEVFKRSSLIAEIEEQKKIDQKEKDFVVEEEKAPDNIEIIEEIEPKIEEEIKLEATQEEKVVEEEKDNVLEEAIEEQGSQKKVEDDSNTPYESASLLTTDQRSGQRAGYKVFDQRNKVKKPENKESSEADKNSLKNENVKDAAKTRLDTILDLKKHHDTVRKEQQDVESEQEELIKKRKRAKVTKVGDKAGPSDGRKLTRSKIFQILDNSESDFGDESLIPGSYKSSNKFKKNNSESKKIYKEITVSENLSVTDFANAISEKTTNIVRELMKLGIMANASYQLDRDSIELIANTLGHKVVFTEETTVEKTIEEQRDNLADLKPRNPVVTIMGHVDHGKTSLLDALKQTDVAGAEAGGITQHIGAYLVTLKDGRKITFIDTPGHEAFTAMRSRGSKITDIVVLVVAADDGIMTQTVEAINHAKAAGVPIIVAINKMDKPGADIERIKSELMSHNLVPEEYGGDVMIIPVSALKKMNLDKLEESILLMAEVMELKANPDTEASGTVIESKMDKNKGILSTVLVQRGTLKTGDLIVVGSTYGRVRTMCNDKGKKLNNALPSVPVEISGLNEAPTAGDKFIVAQNDKQARELAEKYKEKINIKNTSSRVSMEDFLMKSSNKLKTLNVIIRADVQGSIEAINLSLSKIVHEELNVKVIHSGVGAITESDVVLAETSNALVIGFNVRPNTSAAILAQKEDVKIKYYSIIYNIIDDVKSIASGMLSNLYTEKYIGSVEIRQVFNITKVGKIAGSYVTKGVIKRGAGVRLIRDNVVVHEGKLKTLKRFKEEVKEVRENYECGIAFENYEDLKVGDRVEVFEVVVEKQSIA